MLRGCRGVITNPGSRSRGKLREDSRVAAPSVVIAETRLRVIRDLLIPRRCRIALRASGMTFPAAGLPQIATAAKAASR
jgi:hypothetical protein